MSVNKSHPTTFQFMDDCKQLNPIEMQNYNQATPCPCPTNDMCDPDDYYLHPEENLYVCRHCQKRFKLKLMVKVHHCQRTYCIDCHQTATCCKCHSCHPEEDEGGEDAACVIGSDVLVSSGIGSRKFSVEVRSAKTEYDPPSPSVSVIEDVQCVKQELARATSPLTTIPTIVNIVSLAGAQSTEQLMEDNQEHSSHTDSRTISITSNYDFDSEQTMSTISANSLVLDAQRQHYDLAGIDETSCIEESDDGLSNCRYPITFSTIDQCDAHIKSTSCPNHMKKTEKDRNAPNFLFLCDKLSYYSKRVIKPGGEGVASSTQIKSTSCPNHMKKTEKDRNAPNFLFLSDKPSYYSKKVIKPGGEGVASSTQLSMPLHAHDDVNVEDWHEPPAVYSVRPHSSILCSTCQITFSSPESYSEHTTSCFRVWSKAAPASGRVLPVQTYGKSLVPVPPRKNVCKFEDSCIPRKIKKHSNYSTARTKLSLIGMDDRTMHIVEGTESEKLNTVVKKCETGNRNSGSATGQMKTEPDDDMSDIGLDIEDGSVGAVADVPTVTYNSEVVFPQPIAVNKVKSELLLDSVAAVEVVIEPEVTCNSELVFPEPIAVNDVNSESLLCSVRAVEVEIEPAVQAPGRKRRRRWMQGSRLIVNKPRRRRPALPAMHLGQLQQLTMLPTVVLTRCDALVSGRALACVGVHRCGQCALSFVNALQLEVHHRAHLLLCPLCLSAHKSRAARAQHAHTHLALVAHIVGVRPSPHTGSLRFLGLPPSAILPCLDRRK